MRTNIYTSRLSWNWLFWSIDWSIEKIWNGKKRRDIFFLNIYFIYRGFTCIIVYKHKKTFSLKQNI